MSAPFTRASLGRGPAQVVFNSHTFFTRDDIIARHAPDWREVLTSMYDVVDKTVADRIYRVPLKLWGAWENLSDLFPAAVINPVAGTSLFGTNDATLTLWARNGDKLVYTNAALTKMANLHLGVDGDLFEADVEFTAICANTANPEDANAYYTQSTASLTENAFAKTNFKRVRWTATWGALAGFTSFVGQKGFSIGWDMQTTRHGVEGYGTRDISLKRMVASCRAIPVGPTIAQLEAQARAQGTVLGQLLSATAADLTIAGAGGGSVVLKSAGITEHGFAFGLEPLRLGEVVWETTRGFTAGVADAVATVA